MRLDKAKQDTVEVGVALVVGIDREIKELQFIKAQVLQRNSRRVRALYPGDTLSDLDPIVA